MPGTFAGGGGVSTAGFGFPAAAPDLFPSGPDGVARPRLPDLTADAQLRRSGSYREAFRLTAPFDDPLEPAYHLVERDDPLPLHVELSLQAKPVFPGLLEPLPHLGPELGELPLGIGPGLGELLLHSIELLLHSVELSLHSIELLLHSIEPLLYSIELLLYSIELLLHSVELSLHSIEPLLYSIELLLHSIEPLLYSIELPSHFIELPLHSIELPLDIGPGLGELSLHLTETPVHLPVHVPQHPRRERTVGGDDAEHRRDQLSRGGHLHPPPRFGVHGPVSMVMTPSARDARLRMFRPAAGGRNLPASST